MKTLSQMALALVVLCCAAAPARAIGPLDAEVGAVWWANEFDAGGVTTTAGAPGYRAELWLFNKYGMRASQFSSDLDDLGAESSDYTSIDLMWRPFSSSDNSFVAVGLGWQDMDMQSLGLSDSTSGARISAEGRLGIFGALYAYGNYSYLPELDDTPAINPLLGTFEDMDGYEYEVGVSWNVAPFVSLRAGYRVNSVDFVLNDGIVATAGNTESAGFLAGASINF